MIEARSAGKRGRREGGQKRGYNITWKYGREIGEEKGTGKEEEKIREDKEMNSAVR